MPDKKRPVSSGSDKKPKRSKTEVSFSTYYLPFIIYNLLRLFIHLRKTISLFINQPILKIFLLYKLSPPLLIYFVHDVSKFIIFCNNLGLG